NNLRDIVNDRARHKVTIASVIDRPASDYVLYGLTAGAFAVVVVCVALGALPVGARSEEHTSELQSLAYLVCRLLLEKKKKHRHGARAGACQPRAVRRRRRRLRVAWIGRAPGPYGRCPPRCACGGVTSRGRSA